MPFDATAAAYINKKLIVASGSSILSYTLSLNDCGNLIITENKQVNGRMLACDLVPETTTNSDNKEDYKLLYVDIFKSAAVYDCNTIEPQLQNIDYLSKQLTCGCFCNNGVIVCDVSGAVYRLIIDSEQSLKPSALFSFNEPITSITRWRPRHLIDSTKECFAVTTIYGGIYCIVISPQDIITNITSFEEEALKSSSIQPYYCTEPCRLYADAGSITDEEVSEASQALIDWLQNTEINCY